MEKDSETPPSPGENEGSPDSKESEASSPQAPIEVMPDPVEAEEEGGPVKTFLEHLEDLRWVFIRVLSALLVGMAACFAGAPAIVGFIRE
jgi:Sec-independent protein secretion pathway component TatC